MSFLSFSIYLSQGYTLDLTSTLEMITIFTWIEDALKNLILMRDKVMDIKLASKRVNDYLLLDEPNIN